MSNGRQIVLPVLLALAFFALYRVTMAPTIVFGDSGELATAAHVLGVAHPPGYPLYTMIGKIALTIGGGTAAAMNTFSALCAAAAVGALFAAVRRATESVPAALIAALAFGSSPTWWSESIIAEVYPLSLLLLVASAAAIYARGPRLLLLGVYLLGLGALHHPMNVFFGAPLFFVAARRLARTNGRTRIAALVLLVFPVTLLAYLKIRAASDAPLVWGALSTWGDVWDHFMRTGYGDLLAGGAGGPGSGAGAGMTGGPGGAPFLAKGLLLGRVLREELALTALLLAALGFVAGAFRVWRRRLVAAASLALFLGLVILPALLTWEDTAFSNASNRVFFIPVVAILSCLAGFGAQVLARFRGLGWLPWATVLLATGGTALRIPAVDQRGNLAAVDVARGFLKTLPQQANFFVPEGQMLMPVLYVKSVEGFRDDVAIEEPIGIWRERPTGGAPYFTSKETADAMARRVSIAGETDPVIAVPFGLGWGLGTGDPDRDDDPFAMTEVTVRALPDGRIRPAEREVVFGFHLQYARVMHARGRRDAVLRQLAHAREYAAGADGGARLLAGVARVLGVREDEIPKAFDQGREGS